MIGLSEQLARNGLAIGGQLFEERMVQNRALFFSIPSIYEHDRLPLAARHVRRQMEGAQIDGQHQHALELLLLAENGRRDCDFPRSLGRAVVCG